MGPAPQQAEGTMLCLAGCPAMSGVLPGAGEGHVGSSPLLSWLWEQGGSHPQGSALPP